MTADLAVRDDAPLALRPGQLLFDDRQQAALTQMGVKNATKADLAVFAHVCHRTRLDPFTRQIYMIERREKQGDQWVSKQTIQVGIDGFRVIRDRVAAAAGCEVEFEDTIWYDAEGKPYTEWLRDDAPAACRVVLLKHSPTGRALRFPAVLRTAAYMAMKNGQPVSQWKTQAEHMIEKCCEAFATRRAFPNDFSGVYLEEEMHGGGGERQQATARKVTAADIMQPAADDEVAEGELVDETPAGLDTGGKGETGADSVSSEVKAPAHPPQVTAQHVNSQFKRLGFTVRDQADVLTAAAQLAGRGLPVKKVADLDPAELAVVHGRLESCGSRDDLVAMLVDIAADRDASEEADQAQAGDGDD